MSSLRTIEEEIIMLTANATLTITPGESEPLVTHPAIAQAVERLVGQLDPDTRQREASAATFSDGLEMFNAKRRRDVEEGEELDDEEEEDETEDDDDLEDEDDEDFDEDEEEFEEEFGEEELDDDDDDIFYDDEDDE